MNRHAGERGVALMMVIVVLLALAVIATPFALSMRNQDRSAAALLEGQRAAQSLSSALAYAEERLADTDPERDPTPHADGPDELLVEPDLAELGFDPHDPAGTIWSAQVADEQGRADVNQCSPFLLGNLLGARRLASPLTKEETRELKVGSTRDWPDQGIVWIEGELVLYRGRTENALTDLSRAFDTSVVTSAPTAEHASGAAVLDYRVVVAAVYPYAFEPGAWHGFTSATALKDIARFGEVAFAQEELDAIGEDVTTFAVLPASGRFLGAARAFLDVDPDDEIPGAFVTGGRNLGPGTVVRIRSGDREEFNFVIGAEEVGDDRIHLRFQEPVKELHPADETIVDGLARAPVNVNTCSRRMLVALFGGVRLKGSRERVDTGEAERLADLVLAARPLPGDPGFAVLLEQAEVQGVIAREDRLALLVNSMCAGDASLEFGTAPFAFRSYGRFRVDAAASENLRMGREAVRRFARQVTEVVPAGAQMTLFDDQMDFEEAIRLARAGKGWTTFPVNLDAFDRFNQPPLRAVPYLEFGRFPEVARNEDESAPEAEAASASLQDEPPFARLQASRTEGRRDATARGTGRVLHFDEVTPPYRQFNAPDQDGWPVSELGPVALDVDSDLVDLLDQRGFMHPFAMEMWWIPGDGAGGGESVLFDCGESEISNRVFATVQGGVLSFSVADTTIPDSPSFAGTPGGAPPAQSPTQMAEIRFDFAEEGLPLEEGVPYHLKFYARGTKPSDMALFVDGVPRGRRAFQSRLQQHLPEPPQAGPFASIPGFSSAKQSIRVHDARLFPSYGVVRIGGELAEYTSRTDDTLIIEPQPDDPFGGRVARDSFANDHQESEAVELYGYAAVLHSPLIPLGNRTLANALGDFAVVMVDPGAPQVKTPIEALLSGGGDSESQQVGFGLSPVETTIPLVGLAKPQYDKSGGYGQVPANVFSRDGGFALLVSSPLWPPSDAASQQITFGDGQTMQVSRNAPLFTSKGAMIGNSELVRYAGFDGRNLTGVQRAPQSVNGSQWTPRSNLAGPGGGSEDQAGTVGHAHVVHWIMTSPQAQSHDQDQPIFVVPVSVSIGGGGAAGNQYAVPQEVAAGGGGGPIGGLKQSGTLPEMAQIGVGFGAAGAGATEWVRYDTIAGGFLVRDDPERVRDVTEALGVYQTAKFTAKGGKSPTPEAVALAVNFEHIRANEPQMEKIAQDAGLPSGLLGGGMLAFRGVLGTGTHAHAAGSPVLPVFRTVRGSNVHAARPGPRDFVTIVDPAGPTEQHRVNYAYCVDDVEGWGSTACHVAFEDGVTFLFESNFQQMLSNVDPDDEDAALNALANLNLESRDVTRILKFPSGELPTKLGAQIVLGGDLTGAPSPAAMTIDEVEFFNPQTPSPVLPRHPRFVMSRDDDFGGRIRIARSTLRYNLWNLSSDIIETIDPVANLPTDGFVLLIDDELIAVTEVRMIAGEAECEVAVNGRGYLGTPIQFHAAGSAAREMTFLRTTRLEKSATPEANALRVADASDFDPRGVAQVGRELIGYTRNHQGELFMPAWTDPGEGRPVGLLRGSYGTERGAHEEGSLVYAFPYRHADLYRPRADEPELGYLPLRVNAKGAFFREASWEAEGERELVDLVVQARVGGRGAFTDDPRSSPDVFEWTDPGGQEARNAILRQGDALELRVFVRYLEGAFDARVFDPDPPAARGGSNDWKRAPHLRAVGVDWVGGPSRLAYEEWR